MENLEIERKIVQFFIKKNTLINLKLIEILKSNFDLQEYYEKLISLEEDNLKKLLRNIEKSTSINYKDISLIDIDRIREDNEEKIKENEKDKENEKNLLDKNRVNIIDSYDENSKKREVKDFVNFFNSRYKAIEKILKNRAEMNKLISISRLQNKKDKEPVSVIGMINDINITKNGNIILDLEDPTGNIKILVNKNKPDLFEIAKDFVLDETIGVTGTSGDNIIFSNNIFLPEVPANKELKKSENESFAIFLSDIHVGSRFFLEKEFNNFIRWLNKDIGNEDQKKVAEKIKYIFIVGDLIDGCGIYPEQDSELVIKDVTEQYSKAAELLSKIPDNIKIIICAGNHDALRIAEPQPPLYKDFAKDLYKIPNLIMTSNPSMVNIESSEKFSGFDVLLYHGYSFDYYIANVESIRNQHGYDRADLVMKFLLQKRHLAPTHTSTLYTPDIEKDPLVIDKIPDFFVTGHIHKSIAANYKNITMICGSCWQARTPFQVKVGHNPEPGRVPIVNLQTREVKILKFV